MKYLVLDAKIFGVDFLGGRYMINNILVFNALGAGVTQYVFNARCIWLFRPLLQWWKEGYILHC